MQKTRRRLVFSKYLMSSLVYEEWHLSKVKRFRYIINVGGSSLDRSRVWRRHRQRSRVRMRECCVTRLSMAAG